MTIFYKGFALFFTLLLTFSPFATQAWFFPFAAAQSDVVPVIGSFGNSQTIGLMNPVVAMASDRQAVDVDAVITIDGDNALLPEMGSAGTLADVIEASPNDTVSIYVVQSGDSIPAIANRFGVSENTVRWANGLKKGQAIHVGDTLIVLPVTGVRYTIKKGDTIASIEKKFKLDTNDEISSFVDFNNIDSSSVLVVGTVLIVPGAEIAESVASTKPTKSGGHITGAGDLLSSSSVGDIIRDYFIKPVPCPLSQRKHDHYAVDLSCHTIGTPIKAAADGTVMFAKYGYNGGFGNLIIIKHPNGLTTFYAHIKNDGINVSQGQSVSQGQVIAYVGSTGRSTGPHLHFEVRGGRGNPGFDYSGSAWKQ